MQPGRRAVHTRTPLRVTLGGGGTDLPSYYRRHGGFILAMGIDKYIHVGVDATDADGRVRLHYEGWQIVEHVRDLQHDLARAALESHGMERGIEVVSVADLPAGTGLGSSSAYLVGLLRALHELRQRAVSPAALAEEACRIELDVLRKGIGKQDQYLAAFGGLTVLDIARSGEVSVRSIELPAGSIEAFVANTQLYFTGVRRSAEKILQHQNDALLREGQARRPVEHSLHAIRDLGYRIMAAIESADFDAWGELLHEHWSAKRRLAPGVSLSRVDAVYEQVRREFGVLGGKIAGAGGGGFIMLYAPRNHAALEAFMLSRGMPRLCYAIERMGTAVRTDPIAFSADPAPGVTNAFPAPDMVSDA